MKFAFRFLPAWLAVFPFVVSGQGKTMDEVEVKASKIESQTGVPWSAVAS